MSDNVQAAQLVQAGFDGLTQAEKDALCTAFKKAVDKFCNGPPEKKMQFCEHMMDEIKAVDPTGAILGAAKYEVPAVLDGVGGVTGFIEAIAAGSGPGAVGAQKVVSLMAKLTTVTSRGWRLVLGGAIRRYLGGRANFPDATLGGRTVEFKGPGDREGPDQFDRYKRLDPKGDLIVVECKSCDGACGPDNTCPPPPP